MPSPWPTHRSAATARSWGSPSTAHRPSSSRPWCSFWYSSEAKATNDHAEDASHGDLLSCDATARGDAANLVGTSAGRGSRHESTDERVAAVAITTAAFGSLIGPSLGG